MWWDLSYNWLQYINPNSADASHIENLENASAIREQIVNKKLKEGDHIVLRFEPSEEFVKRLAEELLKDIPVWVPANAPSSAIGRQDGSAGKSK
ncbi:MAG: hypothetical protein ABTQ25_16375 [Nitrosomonas ureae]